MRKTVKIKEIQSVLDEIYPNPECSLEYETPLDLMVATQLSAQCTDARVNIVTRELFKRYKTAADYANADIDELIEYIKSAGFYKNKSKNLIACGKKLVENFGGEIPDNMEDLLTLDGVGRKTANLLLGELFNKPAVVVDTHCIRLSNRLGLVKTEDPTKIEAELKKLLPPENSLRFCHQLVSHGRAICTARKPLCGTCPLNNGLCPSAMV